MNTVDILSDAVAQIAIQILQAFVPLIVAVLSAKIFKYLNLKNEEVKLNLESSLRDTLHGALDRALKASLVNRSTNKISAEVIADAIASIHATNPQTLSKLGVADDVLERLILAKAKLPEST